jgi:hypothetical protein
MCYLKLRDVSCLLVWQELIKKRQTVSTCHLSLLAAIVHNTDGHWMIEFVSSIMTLVMRRTTQGHHLTVSANIDGSVSIAAFDL